MNQIISNEIVVVLLSGGVDSAVVLSILKEKNIPVVAVTMALPQFICKNNLEYSEIEKNINKQGVIDAKKICEQFDVEHREIDVEKQFQKLIIDKVVDDYKNAITPNPCIYCNPLIKFGLIREWAKENFDTKNIATGHYVKIHTDEKNKKYIQRAKDKKRDQSYFLYRIPQDDLKYTYFPLGNVESKLWVREKAKEKNIEIATKQDSMDICFLPQGDYRILLENNLAKPGNIVDYQGKVWGKHRGLANYTIGQRKGLNVACGKPVYVVEVDQEKNQLIVAEKDLAFKKVVAAKKINLFKDDLSIGQKFWAKIRSPGNPLPCEIIEIKNDSIAVSFEQPVFAPTPGQHLVIYDQNECIIAGGEIIK